MPMETVTLATDWDGDGDTDLVLGLSSFSNADEIQLVENDGTGQFLTPTPVFQSGPGTGPDIAIRDLRTADLDGDGDEELVFLWSTGFFGTTRYSYLINESGTFNNRVDIRTYPAGQGSQNRFITDFDADGDLDAIEVGEHNGQNPTLSWLRNDRTFGQAVTSCPGLPNSAGHLSHLEVVGSQTATVNRTTLAASQLPGGEFTLFLLGDGAFSGAVPFGSQGRFCLNGSLGRFNRLGELRKSDSSGQAMLAVDLNDIPTPAGSGVVTAGTTKVFQAWHRDTVAGSPTSNFTNAVALTFL